MSRLPHMVLVRQRCRVAWSMKRNDACGAYAYMRGQISHEQK